MTFTDKTVQGALQHVSLALKCTDADVAEPYWLLCHVLGCKRSQLDKARLLNDVELQQISCIVKSRTKGIALDYILGFSEFFGNKFVVDCNVLLPRMETEICCEKAIQYISAKKNGLKVLDLCTGSGCIAATIGCNCDNIDLLVALDVDEHALKVASVNLQNIVGDRCKWQVVQSDMFCGIIDCKFDLIVSNPPYIAKLEANSLSKEVLGQPHIALFGGEDGLDFYRQIAMQAGQYLSADGLLILEIVSSQGCSVSELLNNESFVDIEIFNDLSGLQRVVVARWRG